VSLRLTEFVVIKTLEATPQTEAQPRKKPKARPVRHRLTAVCCGKATNASSPQESDLRETVPLLSPSISLTGRDRFNSIIATDSAFQEGWGQ